MRSHIWTRLLAWFLLVSLLPTVSVAYVAYRFAAAELRDTITDSLVATANDRARNIEAFFQERERDVTVLALDPTVGEGLAQLHAAFEGHGVESDAYQEADDQYRDFLTHLAETYGYHDLFLIGPDGTVVFTVIHEADFGTNLHTGPYRETQLAHVFENACTLLETGVSDFEMYEPSGVPAAFLAAPVLRDGKLGGAIALQLGTSRIHALVADHTGLGETGETVLAAKQGAIATFIAPTRHDPNAAFSRTVETDVEVDLPLSQALLGHRGSGISTDYRDQEVLAAWRYLPRTQWAMVVKIDTREAFAPIRTLGRWGLGVGILAVLAVILLALLVARGFSRPISRLAHGTAQLAAGDLAARVKDDSHDEIGDLAKSFNKMAASLQEMGTVAQEIAAGNLDHEVAERGEDDALARSVNQMVTRLRELTELNRHQLEHATRLSDFKDALRRGSGVEDVADQAVRFLCDRSGANVGTVYIRGKGLLNLVGSHAYARREGAPTHFEFGEGLVGQAFKEDREILLTDVAGSGLRVVSGLVDAPTATVLLLPFRFESLTLGVVEIGFLEAPGPHDLAFLRDATESMGIAVMSALSRAELEEMLRKTESQAQALEAANEELQAQQEELKSANEELQVQEEELRQTNEELEEKADELAVQGEELRQANEELEEKARQLQEQQRSIREQNRKIEGSRRELEVRAEQLALTSRYKSEFLANMSHELRTPLNSMLILSSLLADNAHENLTAKQVEYADTIHTSGEDLLTLINEVLDLAKVESGTMTVEVDEVRFEALADEMRRNFDEVAEQGRVSFDLEAAPDLPPQIHTDGHRLKQVLKNLLSNAFKFTETGGVTLGITAATGGWTRGHAVLDGADAVVAFAVSDTGIGIPEVEQRVIFEAFQQADGSASRRYGGTGLGLSISREIAALLGGELTLRSKPGEGSTFTLFLPLTRQAAPRPAATAPLIDTRDEDTADAPHRAPAELAPPFIADDRDALEAGERTVLLIEDDPVFARALRDMVRGRGFRCIAAGDGETGLDLAVRFGPDAIVLDIKLPGIDGWAVLQELKKDVRTRPIPVHVVSAAIDRQRAIYSGAIAALEKPVDREQLDRAFADLEAFIDRPHRRLLLVEDDAAERCAITALLDADDVTITAVRTGAEALETLQAHSFDCMVLDLGLPGVDGFEILQRMQEQGLDDLPVVVYTGRELTRQEAVKLGRQTRAIVVKDAHSPDRLLQETALFLHRVHEELPSPNKRTTRRAADPDLAGKKLLVVDDDLRNIFALTSVLESAGAQVRFAENGRDGIAMLERFEDIDAVLMDIMMPEMDGFEAIRRIRATPGFRDLPVIALTAKAMKGDRQQCLDAGASDYIAKPVDVDQLLSLLRVWLYER